MEVGLSIIFAGQSSVYVTFGCMQEIFLSGDFLSLEYFRILLQVTFYQRVASRWGLKTRGLPFLGHNHFRPFIIPTYIASIDSE